MLATRNVGYGNWLGVATASLRAAATHDVVDRISDPPLIVSGPERTRKAIRDLMPIFVHQSRRHHLQDTTYEKKLKSFFFTGQKIAGIAPILMIFGPNSPQRRDLFLKKIRTNVVVILASSSSSSPSSSLPSPSWEIFGSLY